MGFIRLEIPNDRFFYWQEDEFLTHIVSTFLHGEPDAQYLEFFRSYVQYHIDFTNFSDERDRQSLSELLSNAKTKDDFWHFLKKAILFGVDPL